MDNSGTYSELLEILYAAPLEDSQWERFLDRLCKVTGSIVALFVRNDSAQGIRRLALGAVNGPKDDRTYEIYQKSYRYTDPVRQAFLRQPRVGFIEGEDIIAHEDLVKTETFQNVALPNGLIHVSLISLTVTPGYQEIISLWRGAGRLYLEPGHRQLIEKLLPHIQNVVNIRRALGLLEERALNAEAMLDATKTAAILLDESGHLIHMNDAAQLLALACDGFSVRDDCVVPTDPAKRFAFAELVAACASGDAHSAGGALTLARGQRRRPLQVFVTPLRLSDPNRSGVRALVMATDPDKTVVFPDTILRQLYGLTPAETEVANGLLTGFSVEEIARVRRVSISTVRSQLSSLLSKTGVKGQNELMRLLATLPQNVPEVMGE
jgi:DNA-binding CsgD family transcriptional regulator/PAS domain-containing protein